MVVREKTKSVKLIYVKSCNIAILKCVHIYKQFFFSISIIHVLRDVATLKSQPFGKKLRSFLLLFDTLLENESFETSIKKINNFILMSVINWYD